jgi:hypothetical protein
MLDILASPLCAALDRAQARFDGCKSVLDLAGGVSSEDAFTVYTLAKAVHAFVDSLKSAVDLVFELIGTVIKRLNVFTDFPQQTQRMVFRFGHANASFDVGEYMLNP